MTETRTPVGAETVEQVVRAQLSKALGGRRGMLEAAVPTLAFTVLFVGTKDLRLAVAVSVAVAVALLVVRLVHRSTVQFVMNSLVGIGIGALFAWRAARGGGDANDQALAYFLPGHDLQRRLRRADGLSTLVGGRWSASWSAASPATPPSGTATRRWSGCAAT